MTWNINFRKIFEKTPGLVHARIAGFKISNPRSLIVFVDDDNLLSPDYLHICVGFHAAHPNVGCFGGKSIPFYESLPPDWFQGAGINLGCQDLGDELYISRFADMDYKISQYPEKSPIGTGMAVAYKAFSAYLAELNDAKLRLGRKGSDLTSAEDNDIILTSIKNGFEIAYLPTLVVNHIIPKKRYQLVYLQEMAYKSNISWIKLLDMHQINPHHRIAKWTVPIRQARAWFKQRAWKSEINYIKWKGACGIFQGLSELK
jgi:glycosyltransferase involved in cell wall biosynthesis